MRHRAVIVGQARLGGWRLGAALGFAWAAYPFTAYALQSNTERHDRGGVPDLGLRGPDGAARTRGFFLSLASWTKFAPLLLYPLWLRYPRARPATEPSSGPTTRPRCAAAPVGRCARPDLAAGAVRPPRRGFVAARCGTLFAGLLLVAAADRRAADVLGPHLPLAALRPSPFSIWDWGERGFWGTPA